MGVDIVRAGAPAAAVVADGDLVDHAGEQGGPADVGAVSSETDGPRGASASRGPHAVCVEGRRAERPAGRGRRTRRRPRPGRGAPSASSWTTARPVSRSRVVQVGVGVEQGQHPRRLAARHHQRARRSARPGRPRRRRSTATPSPPSRPRSRRAGSRSPSGSRKGWSVWMVTGSSATAGHGQLPLGAARRRCPASAVPPRSAIRPRIDWRRPRAGPRPRPASSRPGRDARALVAHRDHDPVAAAPRAAPRPGASGPTCGRDVVEAGADRGDQLGDHVRRAAAPVRRGRRPRRAGARSELPPARRPGRSAVGPSARPGVLLPDQRPQRALLLAGEPAEVGELAARARVPAALHQRQHLQHAVVHGARQPGALLGRPRRSLGRVPLGAPSAAATRTCSRRSGRRSSAGRRCRSWPGRRSSRSARSATRRAAPPATRPPCQCQWIAQASSAPITQKPGHGGVEVRRP